MNSHKKKRAVFLDRDGTILKERGYLSSPQRMKFYSDVFKSLRLLQKNNLILIVVTNQSGIGRGYFTKTDYLKVQRSFHSRLRKKGIRIQATYFCPHTPGKNCPCRKPKPGMPLKAKRHFPIDLKKSYVVGDHIRDLQMARRIGARKILVLTGHGRTAPSPKKFKYDYRARNLWAASQWIVRDLRGE